MRFREGDIVRVKKDHHKKWKFPNDSVIRKVCGENVIVMLDNRASLNSPNGYWRVESLRLVRRPE